MPTQDSFCTAAPQLEWVQPKGKHPDSLGAGKVLVCVVAYWLNWVSLMSYLPSIHPSLLTVRPKTFTSRLLNDP